MAPEARDPQALDVVLVHPDLLGLYGDRGNALALRHRAAGHGIPVNLIDATAGQPVPVGADIYLVGGGEDATMLLSHRLLVEDGGLRKALEGGAPCLAVCAGFQMLSQEFAGPDGVAREGLGLLDARCARLPGKRAVGEIVTRGVGPVTGPITGYENHQGNAVLGPNAQPLGHVEVGVGNGDREMEGAVQGNIVATYLHGPVLVRNPLVIDHLLELATGRALPPLEDAPVSRLRRERLRAAAPRKRFSRR
jgi:CobQ-like glutamine amidotransferase family enzyme